jgi:hypothetical protein
LISILLGRFFELIIEDEANHISIGSSNEVFFHLLRQAQFFVSSVTTYVILSPPPPNLILSALHSAFGCVAQNFANHWITHQIKSGVNTTAILKGWVTGNPVEIFIYYFNWILPPNPSAFNLFVSDCILALKYQPVNGSITYY